MDIIKSGVTFQKYSEQVGNPYAAVLAISRDVRKHQQDNNNVPTISESLSYILEDEPPKSIMDYVAFHKRVDKIVEEDLEGVLDNSVKEYVAKSIHNSVKHHKLIFEYPDKDCGIESKIRIHCRQIWGRLGFR